VKKITTTLILSIIVFLTTLLVSTMYVSRKGLETADYFNALALDNFQAELNSDILLTEHSTLSFLTGIPSIYVSDDSTNIIIDEKELSAFRNMIPEALTQFMKVNKYYHNSMFIIDSNMCRKYFQWEGAAYAEHCSRGFVPFVQQGDQTLYDLSGEYDFMGSAHYQQLKRDRKIIWTTPLPTSPVAGKLLTLYVPITLSNGQFFGSFSLSLDIKTINEKLKHHLPYGEQHSALFLVDENDRIISAYPESIMEPGHQDTIRKYTDLLKRHDKGSEHNIIEVEGKECFVYQRDQLRLPWRIFSVNHSDAIYEEANRVIKAIILSSLTGMLLMLICCALIYRQIRKHLRQKAAAEEELRMAAKVQSSMLKPTTYALSTPSLSITLHALVQPAKEAGGDLYDYVEKDGKLIFCIGDVSGKGMPAALFMTQVVSLFRNAVGNTSEPAEIVGQINRVLAKNNPEMTFCTFFVGVLSGKEITFCNAGHNPPMLVPATSEPSFLKVRPNLAVGLMECYPYQSETIAFSSGDKLLLYTDGVTEAKNKDNVQYGEDRLLEELCPLSEEGNPDPGQLIITKVSESIGKFVQQAEQSDDITIVSIVSILAPN